MDSKHLQNLGAVVLDVSNIFKKGGCQFANNLGEAAMSTEEIDYLKRKNDALRPGELLELMQLIIFPKKLRRRTKDWRCLLG